MKRLLLLVAWLFFALPAVAAEPIVPEGVVSEVVVEGTRRIEKAVVVAASSIHAGETIARQKSDVM